MAVEHETCPGCGVILPVIDGPVHAYYSSSPSCWALNGVISSRATHHLSSRCGAPSAEMLRLSTGRAFVSWVVGIRDILVAARLLHSANAPRT